MADPLDILRKKARQASSRAYAPYSRQATGAALLLSDGHWVAGVRTESVSYSLVIPALVAACTTAVSVGRTDAVAVALSRAIRPEDVSYMRETPFGCFEQISVDAFIRSESLPGPERRLDPLLECPEAISPGIAIPLARSVAHRAFAHDSQFPVGCVLKTQQGALIPGVNVEHRDWSRTLCAERSALAAAIGHGADGITDVYVSCLKDPDGSPCGACRQLLVELAPAATIWLDRGPAPPERTTPALLLPGAFRGKGLGDP